MLGFDLKYINSYLCNINVSNCYIRFLLELLDPKTNTVVYTLSFSHNTEVTIYLNKNKDLLYLNIHTTVFDFGSSNSNKNRM